jgi:prepilin-type N-terminal cleavage/methylation domain-containing protein
MKKFFQKGFTLAEILIVLACSAIIGTILVTLLVQGSSIFNNQTAKVNQNVSLNNASSQISQAVQYASEIASSYTNGQNTYTSGSDVMVIKTPSVDSSGGVIDSKFDTIVLMKDPGKNTILKKLLFPDPASSRSSENTVLLNQLTYLQFIYLNDSAVVTTPQTATKIDFVIKMAEKTGNDVQESSISGRINLKNL